MKLTAQIADQLVAFVKGGASGQSAAAVLDVPLEIFNSWLDSDLDFAKRIEHAAAESRVLAEINLRQKSPATWLNRRPAQRTKASKPATPAKRKHKPWGKSKVGNLTFRQARFVREYLRDSNGTQAAIRAGFARGSADVTASRLLDNPRIFSAIETRRARLLARTDISIERVMQELACIAFANPQKLYDADGNLLPISEMPEYAARAIASFEVEELTDFVPGEGKISKGAIRRIKMTSKTPALEQLAKHLGAFNPDRPEPSGVVTIASLRAALRKKYGSDE